MNKIWTSLFMFLIISSLHAQLVNIESIRMKTDSIRFVLKSDFLFNYSNNDGIYIYRFNLNLNTQYKTKNLRHIFFFSGNAILVRSEDQDFQNSWFLHLRYNMKLNDKWRLEGFIQDQNNELLSINSRNILGLGLRYKFVRGEYFQAYLGNSYMYEKEKSDVVEQTYYNHRNSTYLSFAIGFEESKLKLVNTIYFQPLYTDISNFRLLEQFKAEMPLFKKIKASMLFNYFYNNMNPFGTSEFSSVFSVGLTYDLEKALTQQEHTTKVPKN